MTTAECLVCNLLGCGEADIEPMFGTLTEHEFFVDLIDTLKEEIDSSIDAQYLWERAMESAILKSFGNEIDIDQFCIHPNFMCSTVEFVGNEDKIEDFTGKAEKFEKLTGLALGVAE